MATETSFIEFVKEQLKNFDIRERKMFGEYMIYVSDKPVLLCCDNTLFVKKFTELEKYSLTSGVPYVGAKEHYVLDPDDERFCEIVSLATELTPAKKEKKKRV